MNRTEAALLVELIMLREVEHAMNLGAPARVAEVRAALKLLRELFPEILKGR